MTRDVSGRFNRYDKFNGPVVEVLRELGVPGGDRRPERHSRRRPEDLRQRAVDPTDYFGDVSREDILNTLCP